MPTRPEPPRPDDSFTLFDLRVEVVATERPMVCGHRAGDWFELRGEMLVLPPGQGFPLYPLAALLPLLPAKQRPTHPHDWMTTDAEVACPDPHCGARFRITRTGTTTFSHAAVTAVPLPVPDPDARVKADLRPAHRHAPGTPGGDDARATAGDAGAKGDAKKAKPKKKAKAARGADGSARERGKKKARRRDRA